MGYTTEFTGKFNLDKPLAPEHFSYLRKFNDTRRMKRSEVVAARLQDPVRVATGLPVGEEGEFFVGAGGMAGQDRDESVVDYNRPPKTQPGLWCGWTVNDHANAIIWDGAEKFYNYVEWLKYIVEKFLKPWGYVLYGNMRWQGEDMSDTGYIVVKDNEVSTAGLLPLAAKEPSVQIAAPPPAIPLTPEEFAKAMEAASRQGTEEAHLEMDKLLCEQLEALGYKAGVEVFRNTKKWYA
jgi:hypothetical protein